MERRRSGRSAVRRAVVLGAVWAGLVSGDPEGLTLGLAVVPAATWLSLHLLPPGNALRPLRIVAWLPGFHLGSLLGGLDVAARVLDPRLPLATGWLKAQAAPTAGGRVALGAVMSLMPGTLVAGSDGDRLVMHVLDRAADPEAALRREAARLAALHEGAP